MTLLFADIEGSTRLLTELGDRYADVLAHVRDLLRGAFRKGGGNEVDTQGDAMLTAFPRASDAVLSAIEAQRSIFAQSWPAGARVRVRMGLHTGEPVPAAAGYVGIDVHRAARIGAAGHGGQILLSQTTRELVEDLLPEEIGLRDLGEHRLKDLSRPQRLFHVVAPDLPDDFPPLRSLDASPNNLPTQLTSFIGREREIRAVRELLQRSRLVTLTGAGGSGKTRLALQVAADLVGEYPDGVWWVDLAGLADPALVPQAAASAVGIRERAARPLLDTLLDELRPRHLLLILDDCEHLLAACARLADAVLRRCPQLRLLATSRERLRIGGETVWAVPPLAFPDPRLPGWEHAAGYESVRLFIERALTVRPGFTVTPQNVPAIVSICQDLDGIPLGVELAAARVSLMSPEQIAARLGDRFRLLTGGGPLAAPRHQTLRAAMDWSYELLSDPERLLLQRLSVFAGGFTLDALESVCAARGTPPEEVLDLLASLVDKSLVIVEEQAGEVRYRLLETVRQYAREKLEETGEATPANRQHRDFYLALAERAEPGLRGSDQAVWLRRLDAEYDNLRAAGDWSRRVDETPEAGLRLVWALWHYWDMRAYLSEGRDWVAAMLARAGEGWPALRIKALNAAGVLAYRQGDYQATATLCGEARVLADAIGDTWGLALALHYLAHVAQVQGDHPSAAEMMAESVALYRRLGETWGAALSTNCLGDVARSQGDHPKAAALLEESLADFRSVGDRWGAAMSLHNLGYVRQRLRESQLATAHFMESLAFSREFNFREVTIMALAGLAGASAAEVDPERAARLLGAADALLRAAGGQMEPADRPDFERNVEMVRARLGATGFAAAWAEGQRMNLDQAIEYALTPLAAAVPKAPAAKKADLLTSREREVATLVARGLTNREIATLLFITERTAETHVQHILNKLGLSSRVQIAAWAVQHGLYTPAQN